MDILVVDDVAFMRKIIMDIMANHIGIDKAKLHEAKDGEIALMEYKKHKPGMVFLDVLMPVMNGQEVVKEILKINPQAYIIMCSGANEKAVVKDCIMAGAKDFIIKPVDPARVKAALEKGGYDFGTGSDDEDEDDSPPPARESKVAEFDE